MCVKLCNPWADVVCSNDLCRYLHRHNYTLCLLNISYRYCGGNVCSYSVRILCGDVKSVMKVDTVDASSGTAWLLVFTFLLIV